MFIILNLKKYTNKIMSIKIINQLFLMEIKFLISGIGAINNSRI